MSNGRLPTPIDAGEWRSRSHWVKLPAVDIESISAITLGTHDMRRAVAFYESLGFVLRYGGTEAPFTSFHVGDGYLNLTLQSAGREWSWWGRVIFYVADVDQLYRRALEAGLRPQTQPRDAEWGERYFHIADADGHELSFARPLAVTRSSG